MKQLTCSIAGCETAGVLTRGWCGKHYRRWRTHGDPLKTLLPRREWGQGLTQKGDCLLWEYSLDTGGYGRVNIDGRQVAAHRYAYELANGSIPAGLIVDHTCHNRACVNVDHLRLATKQQNNANRSGATALSSTGVRGVYPDGDRFKVGIRSYGTLQFYGAYDSIEEAGLVAERERRRIFGDYAGQG